MKKRDSIMIIVLVVIVVIIGITIWLVNNKKEIKLVSEQNGIKTSISEKIKEEKKLDNLIINNIQINEENGETTVIASVENTTTEVIQEFPITIKLYNKKKEVIQSLGGYVGTLKAGETISIMATITYNIDEVYDISFEK